MIKWLKTFFTYQACTDEIKVTVDGKRFVADLDSLAKSEVVKQQIESAKYYKNP
ncbi:MULTISPECIES: hypothetical protein [unclassified Pseudoalteromonas]|uniref:hypothetical protein n=1 Tax=unclassified Pseudoalteromonas TaxID=194690 RepID=UPI0023586301|nr:MULTISPECIES: hypothetical protein [unclassified Pseudoalteromonas]MDC9565871.1 hypothetical protein [Pseudoalteromonas sp. GAB2316C]MDC9570204.1 hypothetical protein [Pseudoalteromonas sp. GABNB9D]MDC9574394.1 hypothetical protein [Pseudoalteromonas sp. GABNS16A]MDC9578685.1 hypothetical protein [Pseudoalteromonas sp. GABNS16E]MDC9586285.1 hypothetical protein [Pseudoalteromonas sp. GABNS16C]